MHRDAFPCPPVTCALFGYFYVGDILSVTRFGPAPAFETVNRLLLSVGLVCAATSFVPTLHAAAAPATLPATGSAEVEVSAVKFNSVRPSNGAPGNWLEADVAVEARPAGNLVGRMVARVRVTLSIGFELPAPTAGGERRFEFYRSEAECVALEAGRANVRFYLPPELVKRDQLHGDPKYWGVELAVAGRAVPAGKVSFSAALPSPEARKSFLNRVGTAAIANDGLLVPQYLSPFALDYPRATPSFVRREARESANKIP